MKSERQPTGSRVFGDLILPFVIGPIPSAMSDIRPPIVGEPPTSTLIYSDAADYAKLIAKGIAGLGRDSIIVQDTYLAILQFLPSFGGVCAPGHWIDGITSMCIRFSLPVSIPYRKFHGAQLRV